MKKKYYVTFGRSQANEGGYIEFLARNEWSVREEMLKRYGDKWSAIYTEEQWNKEENLCRKEYSLLQVIEIPLSKKCR